MFLFGFSLGIVATLFVLTVAGWVVTHWLVEPSESESNGTEKK